MAETTKTPNPRTDRPTLLRGLLSRQWAMERHALLDGLDLIAHADIPSLMIAARQAELASPASVSSPCPSVSAAGPASDAPASTRGYYLADSVAVIELVGPLAKQVPACAGILFPEVTSTVETRHALQAALDDPRAASILLIVDSPGGEVAGTQELADAVFDARARKPIHAHISDLGASAAYWIASQALTVSANATAMIGSIGAYGVVEDVSAAYAEAGVTVHVISSGEHKGELVEGVPIAASALEPLQELINAEADIFIAAIARGRGLQVSDVRALADGRVWLAEESRRLRLIDRVENSGEALDRAATAGTPAPSSQAMQEGGATMALNLFGRKSAPAAAAQTTAAEAPESTPAATPPAGDTKPDGENKDVKPNPAPAAEPAKDPAAPAASAAAPAPDRAADVVALADVIGYDKAVAAVKAGLTREQALSAEIADMRTRLAAADALAAKGAGEPSGVRSVADAPAHAAGSSYGAALDKARAGIAAKMPKA